MRVNAYRFVSALGVVASVWGLSATSASASIESGTGDASSDEATLATGQDCSKGCIECQRECHESRCMNSCTMQWSGCCMAAGLKPPGTGSCACSNN